MSFRYRVVFVLLWMISLVAAGKVLSAALSVPILRVSARTALMRGLMKRCPHCGIGPIYSGWAHDLGACSHCGLVYEPTEGDTWAFTIIGDRIPVAAGIVIVYFELGSRLGPLSLFAAMTVVIALLLWTTPNRWGLGVALLYLQRTWWPDPLDPIPPSRP